MFPIYQTKEVKMKKEQLKNNVKKLRDSGIKDENLMGELENLDWNFPQYRILFSSTRELCMFINIDSSDYNGVIWRN